MKKREFVTSVHCYIFLHIKYDESNLEIDPNIYNNPDILPVTFLNACRIISCTMSAANYRYISTIDGINSYLVYILSETIETFSLQPIIIKIPVSRISEKEITETLV